MTAAPGVSEPIARCATIHDAADAVRVATALAEDFARTAGERDHRRRLPYDEVRRLAASGLLAITVPKGYGGPELAPSVVAEVLRILATSDPNIAQIPHSHFVYTNLSAVGDRWERRAPSRWTMRCDRC